MQPSHCLFKTRDNVSIGGGMSLRAFFISAYIISATVFMTGCCQPIFNQHCGTCSDVEGFACTDSNADPCTDACIGHGSSGPNHLAGYPSHRPALPHIGTRVKSWGAKAGSHLHDNFITRAVEAHKANKLAKIEAKNAPPWPTFHPVPTGPVFFSTTSDEAEENVTTEILPRENLSRESSRPLPTTHYGQFEGANRRGG